MKTSAMNKIMQHFDSIENISPTENWDKVFQNKLDNARGDKSNSISKFNLLVLVIVFMNIGFIWNALKTENEKTAIFRNDNFKIISDELLISNN